jgi:two-component system, OmpR family, sensor histidine kinase PhoQ
MDWLDNSATQTRVRQYYQRLVSLARWWLMLPRTNWVRSRPILDFSVEMVYSQMLRHLQRDILILLLILSVPFSILFGIESFRQAVLYETLPLTTLYVHIANFLLIVAWINAFVRSDKLVAAWFGVICINLVVTIVQMRILGAPGLILFTLLTVCGPLISLRSRHVIALLTGLLVVIVGCGLFLFPDQLNSWTSISSLFMAIVLGFACIGVTIRRFVRQFAQITVDQQQGADQRARLEQRLLDLRQQCEIIMSLEHDLRQPMRTIQGHLSLLELEQAEPARSELVLPALAATRRSERLINNLLDQARADIEQLQPQRQVTSLERIVNSIKHDAMGLARYYSDPPIPVYFETEQVPLYFNVDREQLERALLNLLDNALAYSPPDGVIVVRIWADDQMYLVEVRDQGPGLPANVRSALTIDTENAAPLGLGLRQVQRMVRMHRGYITVDTHQCGAVLRLHLSAEL